MTGIIVAFGIYAVCILASALIMRAKGYPVWAGILVGLLFWVGVIIAVVLPGKDSRAAKKIKSGLHGWFGKDGRKL